MAHAWTGEEMPYKIISVDDHVLEPPDLFTSRLPARYADVAPRIRRERGRVIGPVEGQWHLDDDGVWADVWHYESLVKPLLANYVCAGEDLKTMEYGRATTYDAIRPGCWIQKDRLLDMDLNSVEVSLCFPNTIPRFCGQAFSEGSDRKLGLLCVRAYNDWMIDEWCAGAAHGRLIPLTIVPLWDPQLAADEIRRCAAKGSHAVSFTENPQPLGFGSLYSGEWEPFFDACEETGTTVSLHIGSSSRMAKTSPDAPPVASPVLTFQYGMHSLIDYIYSGILMRHPALMVAYSESNVGWMAYVLERMDKLWLRRGADTEFGRTGLPNLPSSYFKGQVFGCIVDDESGLAVRKQVGIDQICFETDYPHGDGLFPDSLQELTQLCKSAELTDEETYKFVRGNAIRAYGLERFGVAK
jgi:predicted TIM-barrel fold metal-dependent hydrolase